jgi:hypothetical protein
MFSGKRGAEAGLVTGLVNGFDDLMESLDANVAQQIEADEENDAREEEAEEGESSFGGGIGENTKRMSKLTASQKHYLVLILKRLRTKWMPKKRTRTKKRKAYPAQPEDRK